MLDAVVFWLLVVSVGLAALPIAEALFARLPSRGLVFARPLGLLVVAFPVWLLASVRLVPYGRATAIASLVVLALIALLVGRGTIRRLGADRTARSLWIAGEVVFTVAFAAWALLRSFSPDVWQTEKPMDMALVNTVNRADWFPPADPWQSGTDVNYYYFGHYLVAFLVRVTGVDPAVGFNLAVALFFALVTTAVFGLAATLYEAARRSGDAPTRSPILAGLVAAGLAMLVGNLAGATELLDNWGPLRAYDWFAPSRVIDGTANEFPFFSFLLADLHAHVMVTPLTLVAIAYGVQLGIHGPPPLGPRRAWPRGALELVLAATVVGALYATNSFDFPTAIAVGLGALVVWALEQPGRWRRAATWGGAWVLGAFLLYLPFWLAFSPPTGGLGIVRERVPTSSFLRDYALIYGLLFWIVLMLFVSRFRAPFRYLAWASSALLFVLVFLAGQRLAGQALALLIASLAVFATFASGRLSQTYRILWLLAAVAFGLLASAEVVYVRDAFEGTESFRFNTVFKTGYQAWFLLSVVAGVTVFWSARWIRSRAGRGTWLVGAGTLVILALVYPVAGSYSRTGGFSASPTLDGLRWLEQASPHDVAAIEWLRSAVDGSPTLLETVGPDFDPDGRARVSTFTGIPAVMGWAGHEVQWGHEPGTRHADVRIIYSTEKLEIARSLLERYGVDYVFVGDLERRDYGPAALAKFERLGTPVFRSGGTVVYEMSVGRGASESEVTGRRTR